METYFASLPSQKVTIFESEKLRKHKKAQTLPQLFEQIVKSFPHQLALRCNGVDLSYEEYFQKSQKIAKSFTKIGLERNGCVAIFADNCHRTFITQLATSFAGAHYVCIHTTSSASAAQYILESTRANLIIVDRVENLNKISEFSDKLPHLKAIVATSFDNPSTYTWQNIEDLETDEIEEIFRTRSTSIVPNECCCICFTSGTTGRPKGAMLSHDNLIWNASNVKEILQLRETMEIFVSYLPLSHVAAQFFDFFLPLAVAGYVCMADKNSLSHSLVPSLQKFQPTFLFGVPRIFEKIIERFPLREDVGLNECRYCLVGAAAPSKSTLKLLPLIESYGMTEAGGAITLSREVRSGSVGKCIEDFEVKIVDGEIYLRGRNVFMGYINQPEETLKVLDSDRWLKTGDLGRIDEDGFVYITGRRKELIITSGGENIPFVDIESKVKSELSAISQAILIGNGRKFLVMLITFKCEEDCKTLTGDSLTLMSKLGLSFTKHHEICNNLKIRSEVQKVIDRVNENAFSNSHKIKKFAILTHDFGVHNGELTASLKVRRKIVEEDHQDIIEEMYGTL